MRRKIIGATVGTTINPNKFVSGGVTVTDEQVASAVEKYLEEHPEATTTVQDESISEEKLTAEVRAKLNSSQNVNLTAEQISALDGLFRVAAYIKDDVSAEYNAFRVAFGLDSGGGDSGETTKTLTSISAVYSGGEVAVGTAVADLTGIVVTAHYSDGTSATVTGYTLSGTIAEGSNTITVSYGGKTATFTVTGVAESGEPIDTSPRIAQYGVGLDKSNTIVTQETTCITDFYTIPEGYTGKVSGVVYWDAEADFTTTKTMLLAYNGETYTDVNWSISNLAKKYTEDAVSPGTVGLYYAAGWPCDRFRMTLVTKYVDYDYLYFTDTGEIIFAGKNSPYYGMRNISQYTGV